MCANLDDLPEYVDVKVKWVKKAAKAFRVIEQGEKDERVSLKKIRLHERAD